MQKLTRQLARRVSLIYLLASGLWIYFSDRVLVSLPVEAGLLAWLGTYKGFFFVLVSTALLYFGLLALLTQFNNQQQAYVTELEKMSAEVRSSEEHFRSALKNSPVVIFTQDKDLRYTWIFNPQKPFEFQELIGKSDVEFVEARYHSVGMAPDDYARWLALEQLKRRALASGQGQREQMPLSLGGRAVYFDLTVEPLYDPSGELQGVIGSATDITSLLKANEQIENQVDRLAALRKIDLAITSSLDIQIALNVVLNQATSLLKVDAAAVLLLNHKTRYLEFGYGEGFNSNRMREVMVPVGRGLAGMIALERKGAGPVDLAHSEEYTRQPLAAEEGFVQYYGLPLLARGRLHGVLEVYNRGPRDYSLDWVDFLESLAGQAAIAIDNFKLYEELQRTNLELSMAYDATLEGWSHALELRDRETDGHSQRVTRLAIELAVELGLPEEELIHFRRGTLLHDIGKMGVPDSILLKPGPLDEAEWQVMRQHPLYAYDMLWPIRYLRPALDIPLHHHERWDGSGYPHGLSGEQIPLPARIFAVVDVWDALCNNRPYRQAWSIDRVKQYLRDESGRLFDPVVVEVFLNILTREG